MTENFSYHIKTENIYYKHSKSKSIETGKEFHIFHEIIYFIDGDAEFISETHHLKLKPNTLIVIPKESFHQLIINGNPDNYLRSILQFEDIPELVPLIKNKLDGISVISANEEIAVLFNKLAQYAKKDITFPEIILKAFLTLILNELPKKETHINDTPKNPLISEIIEYIAVNISEDLSLEKLSKKFNISVSSLTHQFCKEMNIPVHRYILKKRLIKSYHLIIAGTPPTIAAIESGFNDYSGFYKRFREEFGFPPSRIEK